jgi:capsular exopolysaccharide synthesis family protein
LRPLGRQAKRILITSTGPGEGKSLVAANLATVFAHDGQRTLLLEADLRRPTAHQFLAKGKAGGVSEVLQGQRAWRDVLQTTGIPNLWVLGAGAIPANPSELLGSVAMQTLLDELNAGFDRIVVDCTPVFSMSDPLALLPLMEGILFVVHFNRTSRRAARRALDKLREGSTPLLGIVLNNVCLRRAGGYYYDYRRYGYPAYYARDTREKPLPARG